MHTSSVTTDGTCWLVILESKALSRHISPPIIQYKHQLLDQFE